MDLNGNLNSDGFGMGLYPRSAAELVSHRQNDGEDSPSSATASYRYMAVVLGHDFLDQRQTEAGTGSFIGVEGIKNALQAVPLYSFAVIRHRYLDETVGVTVDYSRIKILEY